MELKGCLLTLATGVPIKGAASTDFSKTTQPKHFTQPLTCFYWHKTGFCMKTDEECLLVYILIHIYSFP